MSTAAASECPKCGRRVLVGLDDRIAAMEATVDADPVTPEVELAALIAGLKTYTAWPDPKGISLGRRYSWRIARPVRWPTHVEHRCGQVWPAEAIPSIVHVDPERCPF